MTEKEIRIIIWTAHTIFSVWMGSILGHHVRAEAQAMVTPIASESDGEMMGSAVGFN